VENKSGKICRKCKRSLFLENFPPDKRVKDGLQARCRSCICEFVKDHYRNNPASYLVTRARRRALTKGLEFTISESDILPLPERCPVLGIVLRCASGPARPDAFSLDRSDNNKGYVPGNVVVMSYLANRLKNDGTAEQHEKIAAWMRTRGLS
jgi:hypothetical protein